jgi:gas vesicle protein
MGEETKAGEKALFFLIGGFIGAAVALLLAPRSGEEIRRLIATKTREGTDYVANRTKDVSEKTTGLIDRGKELLQQQRDQLAAALEAGKQAYREEKDKAKS